MKYPNESPAVGQALAVEERLSSAAQSGDLVTLRQCLSAELVVSDPANKIRRRDDLIALFEQRAVSYSSVVSTVEFAEQLADLVVVMGTRRTVVETVPPGAPWPPGTTLFRRFTDVFRRESDEWRLLVRQSTVFKTASSSA